MHSVTIYKENGRFAAWPANNGIWSWGSEIVVGFNVGHMHPDGGFHARDINKPFDVMQARSMDGGETWQVSPAPLNPPGGLGLLTDELMGPQLLPGQSLTDENVLPSCPGGIDFTHPDFVLMCARSGLADGAISWFYTSTDRCHSWQGPYRLPLFGKTGVAARTDYLVNGPAACSFFLTAAKADGNEGRVFYVETTDGGRSFDFISNVGPEPSGFAIMPASLRISESRILVALRCRTQEAALTIRQYIDLFASDDNGRSWHHFNEPVANTGRGGNPPTLTQLVDGRICLTYGYRDAPFGMRAKLSADDGATWGDEIILRSDGGNHDLGYPRTIQRPDGTIVTVYYFNGSPEGERYIAATLWEPEP